MNRTEAKNYENFMRKSSWKLAKLKRKSVKPKRTWWRQEKCAEIAWNMTRWPKLSAKILIGQLKVGKSKMSRPSWMILKLQKTLLKPNWSLERSNFMFSSKVFTICKAELDDLKATEDALETKLESRKKQFLVLVQSIHNLQALLDEDNDISFHSSRMKEDANESTEDGIMDTS